MVPSGPPPTGLQRLLAWLLDERHREQILGDLAEAFDERCRNLGARRARWWYRREIVRSLIPAARHRWRRPSSLPPSRRLMLDNSMSSLRYASRTLKRSPGFTLVTVGTLAVAIGVNAALFGIIKQVLLDPLPYPEPDRVVAAWMYEPTTARRARMTPGNYSDLRDLPEVFQSVGAFTGVTTTITELDEPMLLRGTRVTAGYFDALRVPPLLGRAVRPEDELQGGPAMVVLSRRVWMNVLGGDSSAVGTTIELDGTAFEIIGIMPDGLYPMNATIAAEIPFRADRQDFWVPLRYSAQLYTNRGPHIIGVVARLADGVEYRQADTAVRAVGARLVREGLQRSGEIMVLSPMFREVVGDVSRGLVVLGAAVGLVLLVAASNIAGLFLIRSEARRAETILRAALGASRARLIGQQVVESTLVAAAGAVAGVAAAVGLLELVKRTVPTQIPRLDEATIDAGVLVFTAAVIVTTVLLSGVLPALAATRTAALATVREQERAGSGTRRRQRAQFALVAGQTSFAVVLLVGAGLLIRSFANLTGVDTGFRAEGVVMQRLPALAAPTMQEREAILLQLRDRLVAIPGVREAAIARDHPLQRQWEDGFTIDGIAAPPGDGSPSASMRPVTPGYFATAGIGLLAGRGFTDGDRVGGRGVAVVNVALVQRYFAGADPMGRQVRLPSLARMFGEGAAPDGFEIVGVVEDVRFLGPHLAPEPAMYMPAAQIPMGGLTALVRTDRDPIATAAAIQGVVREQLAGVSTRGAETMEEALGTFHARPRFNMLLLTAFAGIAVMLTCIGVYALVARAVALRTREIGIRIALGARKSQVFRTILTETLRPGALGLVGGVVLAAAMSRWARSLLFDVAAIDPLTYLAAPFLLLVVLLVAATVPARRAVAVDPGRTLRTDE